MAVVGEPFYEVVTAVMEEARYTCGREKQECWLRCLPNRGNQSHATKHLLAIQQMLAIQQTDMARFSVQQLDQDSGVSVRTGSARGLNNQETVPPLRPADGDRYEHQSWFGA